MNIKMNEIGLERIKRECSFENILDDEDCLYQFNDYSGSTYICDAISEIADSCVNIYNSELWKHASDNQEYIEQAIAEGLVDTSNNVDLIRIFQAGEYEYYTACLYANLKDLCFNYCLIHIMRKEIEFDYPLDENGDADNVFDRFIELVEEKLGEVEDDNNNRFDDLTDYADEIMKDVYEELMNEFKELKIYEDEDDE